MLSLSDLWKRFKIRLIVFILAASLIPLFLLGITTVRTASNFLKKMAVDKHQAVLDAVKGETELLFKLKKNELEELASTPEVQSLQLKKVDETIFYFLLKQSFFSEISIFSGEGKLIALENKRGAKSHYKLVGKSLTEVNNAGTFSLLTEKFNQIIENGSSFVLNSNEKDELAKQILFLIPIPDFIDSNKVKGILFATSSFDGNDFQHILDSIKVENDEYICIFNDSGEVLAKKGKGVAENLSRIELPFEISQLKSIENSIKTIEVENQGRNDLVSISFSPVSGAFTAMGQPTTRAFFLAENLIQIFQTTILFSIAVSILLSIVFARGIAGPINEITQGIDKIHQGIFTHRVSEAGDDELGEASKALNSLSKNLQRKNLVAEIWQKIRNRE
ncbi:MAG: HAMP domain-containing protein [Candidatus Riflebacteria bacterium]|nr:HAMP domain-containing protein [Candidatus Riflebacteria bacterium]